MVKLPSIYCENVHSGFLTDQPLNTLTNLAFIVAGILLVKLYRDSRIKSPIIIFMITLVFLIGIGSTIWHFGSTSIGKVLDIVPITLLVLAYFIWFLRKIAKNSWIFVIMWTLLFVGLHLVCMRLFENEPLKTGAGYFPIVLMLAVNGIYSYMKKIPGYRELLLCLIAFSLALTFRSTDYLVCASFPLGTHFLWHILNGIVVYLIVKTMVTEQARGSL